MNMPDDVLISLQNVGVAYSKRSALFRREKYWALKDISFDLYRGESLGVIGRNGVGKTTLLQLLAGILSPTRGSIINAGVTASMLSLQVGFMPNLTGKENAILSGMMLGKDKKYMNNIISDISDFADIGDFFYQPVSCYSAGMKARVGFASALYANPDVMLLDEVLGVGDQEFKKKSSAVMRQRIQGNQTVVLVSHNLSSIRELCDRVLWVEKGIVRYIGKPDVVLDKYHVYLKKLK